MTETRPRLSLTDLIEAWKAEEEAPFSGWDFSHLEGRMLQGQPPWSYSGRARELMRSCASVLDMATGGGERMLAMRDSWPRVVAATEGYAPNLRLASERLAPHGVRVVEAEADEVHPLPFRDAEFALVLNRHAALHVDEIMRILSPGGRLLTQQVHGLWASDLLAHFDASPQWPEATPENYLPRLRAAGAAVLDVKKWWGELTFNDVGAVVYYLKAVPWLVPGFSVDTHAEMLGELQEQIIEQGRLVYCAGLYLIEARKPE